MYFIFDIGGTKMRMSYSYDGENLQETKLFSTPQDFDEAMKLIKEFFGSFSKADNNDSKVICGVPGVLDRGKETLLKSPNLPFWVSKPIKSELEKITGFSVNLENDASLGGLGEALRGAGKDSKIVAYLAIGTGIGGVRIVDGKIDNSAFGFEPGHQIIDVHGLISGRSGDLESLVGGTGIYIRYNKKAEEIDDVKIWNEIEKLLAVGIVNTILHWSPDVLILGGGIVQNELLDIEEIKKYVGEYLQILPKVPVIKKGILGDKAGPIGGLMYFKG